MVLIFCAVLVSRRLTRLAGRTHKVNTDGGDVALCVCVVGESKQQARLSNARVSDEEQLEEVVVSGRLVSEQAARGAVARRCGVCTRVGTLQERC